MRRKWRSESSGGSSCNDVLPSGPGDGDDSDCVWEENVHLVHLDLIQIDPDLVLHVEQEGFWPGLLFLGRSRAERRLLVLEIDNITNGIVGPTTLQ